MTSPRNPEDKPNPSDLAGPPERPYVQDPARTRALVDQVAALQKSAPSSPTTYPDHLSSLSRSAEFAAGTTHEGQHTYSPDEADAREREHRYWQRYDEWNA